LSCEASLPVILGAQLRTWGRREAASPESIGPQAQVEKWIPGSRCARPGMTIVKVTWHPHTRNSRA